MASTNTSTNSSKKRHSFFSHFLSTKNLSIFRNNKSSTNEIFKDTKHYQSQMDIHSEQNRVPLCIRRGWLRKQSQRPISLDLDLVKDILINNHEHVIEQQQPISSAYKKHLGTIIRLIFKKLD